MVLIETLALTNINIVGVSLGGMITLQLLADHPSLFNKAVIANSFAETVNKGFKAMAESWYSEFLSQEGPVKRFENFWPKLVNNAFRSSKEGMSVYQNWHAQASTADGESLANIVKGISDFDIRAMLPDIKQRVLVISGELDVISPVSNSHYLSQHKPDAQHVSIKNAYHLPNVDSASAFNSLLIDFLSKKEARIVCRQSAIRC